MFNWIVVALVSVLLFAVGGWMLAGVTDQISYDVANAFLQDNRLILDSPYIFLRECYAWFAQQPWLAGLIGLVILLSGLGLLLLEIKALLPKPHPPLVLKSDTRGEIDMPHGVVVDLIKQSVLQVRDVSDFRPHLEQGDHGVTVTGTADVSRATTQDLKDLGERIRTVISSVFEQQLDMPLHKVQVQLKLVDAPAVQLR